MDTQEMEKEIDRMLHNDIIRGRIVTDEELKALDEMYGEYPKPSICGWVKWVAENV